MIAPTRSRRIFARNQPTDLRKGFAGLAGIVRSEMDHDLIDGDLFLFVSKRRTSAKILHWDGTGLCIYAKRLAKGRFAPVWERAGRGHLRLTRTELNLFLTGAKMVRSAFSTSK